MSKKEEILNLLDGLKALIITCLTGLFGILGYAVINYKSLDELQSAAMGIGSVLLFTIVGFLLKVYLRNLRKLRDL